MHAVERLNLTALADICRYESDQRIPLPHGEYISIWWNYESPHNNGHSIIIQHCYDDSTVITAVDDIPAPDDATTDLIYGGTHVDLLDTINDAITDLLRFA